jgi:hypothetical protein
MSAVLPSRGCRYSELLRHSGEAPVAVRRCETVEEVLREADVSDYDTSPKACYAALLRRLCQPLRQCCALLMQAEYSHWQLRFVLLMSVLVYICALRAH